MRKIPVDSKPDRGWRYTEILDWLFSIRDTWKINNVDGHKPEDFRNTLKKTEVLAFINDTFEAPSDYIKNKDQSVIRYDCYDVEYAGYGDFIKISEGDKQFIFVKGVRYTFYGEDNQLIAHILSNYSSDDFIIAGRVYNTSEFEWVTSIKQMKVRREANESFISVH